ncbi:MAG: UDP-3-O-(3-hydroxymyristoyl)glucosamine N-acyltransferase [Spirochaetales bacterium]|nr:UDP-3-O-(3-hydroxymyristoyl)glucosamine N-acyltransferase [Spirochaetales bacterium]
MNIRVSQLVQNHPDLLTGYKGPDQEIGSLTALEDAKPGALIFLTNPDQLEHFLKATPAAIVIDEKHMPEAPPENTALIGASHVALAHAIIKSQYADRNLRTGEWPDIHPSSVIHPSATLGQRVQVGPCTVIGAGVSLADDVIVMAGCVVESGARVGRGTVIHPRVVIGYDCEIGADCIIKSGTVIGSEGYGFAQDNQKKSYRIPQTGRVVLEDRVLVGANCCIDRATYKETRIGAGTKFDNLCHVAHNVQIGEDCLLTAMLCVAGSTRIGNRVIASGQTGILDHKAIADDVILLHRAGVVEDIDKPGMYAGLPTQPLQTYLRNTSVLRSLVELRKKVIALEKGQKEA